MFKQRNRKVAKTDNKATLDAKHKEITQEFKNNEERLEDFRNELDETNKKIKRYLKKKKRLKPKFLELKMMKMLKITF